MEQQEGAGSTEVQEESYRTKDQNRISKVLRRPRRPVYSVLWSALDSFLPEFYHTSPNPDLQRRGRLFVAASCCFFLIALVFGTQMAMVGWYPLSSVLVMYSGCVLVVFNLVLLHWTRSPAIPGSLLCLELLAIHWFEAYNDLGLRDPVLLWMLILPWLGAFLVSPTYGFALSSLVVLAISSFWWLEFSGHLFPSYTGPEAYVLFYVLCASTLTVFLGFLGWIYEVHSLNLREANQGLRSMQTDLRKAREEAERILDHVTDGYFTLDADWCFTHASQQVEQILNKSRSAILGRPVWEYCFEEDGEDMLPKLHEAARAEQPVRFEMCLSPSDRRFAVLAYPGDGGITFYLDDITGCKSYEEQFARVMEEAEYLTSLEGDLLLDVHHDV